MSSKNSKFVQFVDAAGKRRTIRLPDLTLRQLDTVRGHVKALNAARISNTAIDESTARWLAGIDSVLRTKLVAIGLLEDKGAHTVGPFVDDYMRGRLALVKADKLAQRTYSNEQQAFDSLTDYFGADKPFRDISKGDAKDFRDWLLASGGRPVKVCGPEIVIRERKPLAEATTRKHCARVAALFDYAISKGIIDRNPFDDVPTANLATDKHAFIDATDALAVMKELPSTEWKLLFALARWGGLRVGSEPRRLRWCDVLWDEQKLLVHSHKTRRYVGHATRLVPLFPELESLLTQRFDEAAEGDTLVLPFLASRTDASLRDPLMAAIKRAKVTGWAKLWQNLRSTRQTELEDKFPTHVVCAWLGNSKAIAAKHYLQVTDDHYARAVGAIVKTADQSAANALHPKRESEGNGEKLTDGQLSNC